MSLSMKLDDCITNQVNEQVLASVADTVIETVATSKKECIQHINERFEIVLTNGDLSIASLENIHEHINNHRLLSTTAKEELKQQEQLDNIITNVIDSCANSSEDLSNEESAMLKEYKEAKNKYENIKKKIEDKLVSEIKDKVTEFNTKYAKIL